MVFNYIYPVSIKKSSKMFYCQPLSSYNNDKIAIHLQCLDLLPVISSYDHNIYLFIMNNDRMQVCLKMLDSMIPLQDPGFCTGKR